MERSMLHDPRHDSPDQASVILDEPHAGVVNVIGSARVIRVGGKTFIGDELTTYLRDHVNDKLVFCDCTFIDTCITYNDDSLAKPAAFMDCTFLGTTFQQNHHTTTDFIQCTVNGGTFVDFHPPKPIDCTGTKFISTSFEDSSIDFAHAPARFENCLADRFFSNIALRFEQSGDTIVGEVVRKKNGEQGVWYSVPQTTDVTRWYSARTAKLARDMVAYKNNTTYNQLKTTHANHVALLGL